jgi:hypothetical protein
VSLLTILDKIGKVKRCQNCLITDKCPNTEIGEEQLCNFCKEGEPENPNNKHHLTLEQKAPYREDLDKTLKTVKGKDRYDVLLGFTGGKDSTYLLYKLKQTYPHLRILLVTIDIGFLSNTAFENIKAITNKLNTDHIFIKVNNGFYKKFYKYLFEHRNPGGYKVATYLNDAANEIRGFCDYCHGVADGLMVKYAYDNKIPLVMLGVAPGQPIYMFYELTKEEFIKHALPGFIYQEPFTERDRDYFWEGAKTVADKDFPRIIFPFHVMEYNADGFRRELAEAGIIPDYKRSSPAKTNCSLNFVMTFIDYMIDEYFMMLPYAAKLIRNGELNRNEWRKRFIILEAMLKNSRFLLKHARRSPLIKKVRELEKILDISVEDIVAKHKHQALRLIKENQTMTG